MLDIRCPRCGTIHHAGEEHIGRLLKCAGCGDALPITQTRRQNNSTNPPIGLDGIDFDPSVRVNARTSPRQASGHRKTVPRLVLASAVFLSLVAITGVIFHLNKKYAALQSQLDKEVQDQVSKKISADAQSGLDAAPHTQESDSTSPMCIQSEDDGQKFFAVQSPEPNVDATRTRASSHGGQQPTSHRDFGVDIATPNAPSTALMEEPNDQSATIRSLTSHDVLALIRREPENGWYDVIDIHSGKEGWIRREDVNISLTQHPIPAARFSEEYVGSNSPPDVTVANQTDQTLTLRIGDTAARTFDSGTHLTSIPEGTFHFYATVPDTIPAMGTQNFKRGYRYTWTFWVEGRSSRSP